jgi:hypothetical protein
MRCEDSGPGSQCDPTAAASGNRTFPSLRAGTATAVDRTPPDKLVPCWLL